MGNGISMPRRLNWYQIIRITSPSTGSAVVVLVRPETERVVDAEILVLHQVRRRRGLAQDLRHGEGGLDQRVDHVGRRIGVAGADEDPVPAQRRRPRHVVDRRRGDGAVRNDDDVPRDRAQARLAPVGLDHFAFDVADGHPVAGHDGTDHVEGHAREQVAEHALQRKADDGGDQRAGAEDRGDIDAQLEA